MCIVIMNQFPQKTPFFIQGTLERAHLLKSRQFKLLSNTSVSVPRSKESKNGIKTIKKFRYPESLVVS